VLATIVGLLITPGRTLASAHAGGPTLQSSPRFRLQGVSPWPRRALVVEPFATDLGDGDSTGQDVTNYLKRAGFAVTVLRDSQVTVPTMLNLSQYAFVYFSTHAGPLPNNDAAISTGDTRHQPFAEYLDNYSLAEMKITSKGEMKYFDAVTGRFIHLYDGTFPAHTIIYVTACNALDMPVFWRYLHQSGVGTLIGWHHHVSIGEADQAAEAMFASFAKGRTVSQAIADATASGYGVSLLGKKKGWLSFSGNGAATLQQAAGIDHR
jgi:hypothetical protein